MTKQIPTVNTATDTFSNWVERTNQIITTVNTEVMTANSNANGATTTGNSFLVGIFGANTICVPTGIRGGNVQASATLTITSNVAMSGDKITFGNVTITNTAVAVSGVALLPTTSKVSANTAGLTTQIVDEFPVASFSGADYSLVIKDTTTSSNAYQISKLVLVHNGISAYSTEYGVMHTNSTIGTFSSSINGSNATLYFTPLVANCQISGVKVIIDKI